MTERRRSEVLPPIRVSPEEKAALYLTAEEEETTVSDMVRNLIAFDLDSDEVRDFVQVLRRQKQARRRAK
jgi:hypothetical protein